MPRLLIIEFRLCFTIRIVVYKLQKLKCFRQQFLCSMLTHTRMFARTHNIAEKQNRRYIK